MLRKKILLKFFASLATGGFLIILSGCVAVDYEVKTETQPEETGKVTGAGTYKESEEVILKAEPEEGYKFDYWELEGEEVSTDQEYTFEIDNDIRLTAHFSARDLELVLDKAEEAINNENWKDAGIHLQEARQLPGAEEEPFCRALDATVASGQDVLSMMLEGKVATEEEISEDLEEIDELAPREPEVEVLDQKPEELYEWFTALREWRVNLQTVPYHLGKLIHENGIQQIRSRSEQYLEAPVEMTVAEWEINDTDLYYFAALGISGPGSPERQFLTRKPC